MENKKPDLMEKGNKFVIIGLDGGTFDIIMPFIREGYLPNIAKMLERGSHGILESTIPPVTAPAWTSFMTGKNPGKHGILHFFEFSKDEKQLEYSFKTGKFLNFSHIRESTIFELLGENGKEVISINMPLTYPPHIIKGKMISCWLTPPGSKVFTYPTSLRDEYPDYRIDQYFGERLYALTPSGKEINAEEFFPDINDVLNKRAKTALDMISNEKWDLFMLCFTETDRVHHFFWRAINRDYPLYDTPQVQEERRLFIEFYKKLDSYIGVLIEEAEKKGAVVCVMSDHGFGPPPSERFHMNYYLRSKSYIKVNNDGLLVNAKQQISRFKAGRVLLRDIMKLSVKTSPVGTQNDVDWSFSKAWSVCLNNNIGGIFLNRGSIDIPIEKFKKELCSELFSIKDSKDGKPIVQDIYNRESLFIGEHIDKFPDLIYILNKDYEAGIEGGFDLFANSMFSRNNPYPPGRGNHNRDGMYIFYGKDIQSFGKREKISIMDILPTILFYLNIPIPDDLDGKPLLSIWSQAYLRNSNPPVIQKVDLVRYKSLIEEDGHNDNSIETDMAIQEKLKQLGYM